MLSTTINRMTDIRNITAPVTLCTWLPLPMQRHAYQCNVMHTITTTLPQFWQNTSWARLVYAVISPLMRLSNIIQRDATTGTNPWGCDILSLPMHIYIRAGICWPR